MCSFTNARIVAIVLARSTGSESTYCAGVLTFDGGFMDSSSSETRRGIGPVQSMGSTVEDRLDVGRDARSGEGGAERLHLVGIEAWARRHERGAAVLLAHRVREA